MNGGDLRRWVADHRAAADRERRAIHHHRLTAAEAFASALALLRYDEGQNGSPFQRVDPVSISEDDQLRDNWARLRARWRRDG